MLCCKTQMFWTLKSFKLSILSVTECYYRTCGVWGGVSGCSPPAQPNTVTFLGRCAWRQGKRRAISYSRTTNTSFGFDRIQFFLFLFLKQCLNHVNTSEPDFFLWNMISLMWRTKSSGIICNLPEFMQILTKQLLNTTGKSAQAKWVWFCQSIF